MSAVGVIRSQPRSGRRGASVTDRPCLVAARCHTRQAPAGGPPRLLEFIALVQTRGTSGRMSNAPCQLHARQG
jgi:hypothetical protein